MPIGSGIVYNTGDLILSQVSSSGTAFLETKIAAATSSLIYFDSTARINSASLNSITVGTASYVSGSTSIITNLTASNISASGTGSFGMVGIGTTSPAAKLHIYNGSSHFEATSNGNATIVAGLYALQIGPLHDRDSTAGRYYGGIAFNHLLNFGGATTYNGAPQAWIGTRLQDTTGSERDYLVFATKPGTGVSGTGNDIPIERMCIDRDGLVGIGTTVPAYKLDVIGPATSNGVTLRLSDAASLANSRHILLTRGSVSGSIGIAGSQTEDPLWLSRSSGYDLIVASSGNIGIGTSIPGALLEISSSTASSLLNVKGAGGNGILFVSGSGDVAVGITNPELRFRIDGYNISASNSGTSPTNGILRLSSQALGSTNLVLDFGVDANSSPVNTWIQSRNRSNYALNYSLLLNPNGGNVGIGSTAPNDKLDVVGRVYAYRYIAVSSNAASPAYATDTSTGMFNAAANQIGFSISSAEKVRIDGNGNVGIGTTAPAYKLTVQNDAASTNALLGLQNFSTSATTNHGVSILPILSDNTGSTAITAGGLYWLKEQQWTNDTTSRDSYLRIDTTENGSASEKVRITSAGNVGIGTTSPTRLLQVNGTAYLGGYTTITGNVEIVKAGAYLYLNSTNSDAELLWMTGGSPRWAMGMNVGDATENLNIYNYTTATINFSILKASGNVGIGTSSPGAKLDVNGDVYVSPNTAGKNTFILSTNASNDARLLMRSDVTTKVDIQANGASYFNGGNVGIGTSVPGTLFQVFKAANGNNWSWFNGNVGANLPTGFTTGVAIGTNYSNGLSEANLIWGHGVSSNQYFAIAKISGSTSYSEQLRIDINGNVGIGTTTIGEKLTVSGSSYIVGGTGAVGTGLAYYLGDSTNRDLAITRVGAAAMAIGRYYPSAWAETIRFTADGNIGIGTTVPADKLHVIGNIRINGGDILNWGGQAFIQTIGANDMFFRPNSTLRMILTAAGNLGLGNGFTSPAYLLDVSGSSRHGYQASDTHQFTGSVSISGSLNATASWAQNVVSASYATTAQTANALNASNTYTIAGLTSAYVDVNGSSAPTTGIYRPSTKTLGLSADSTLIFKISNVSAPATSSIETGNFVIQSGNFGLGTNSPNNKLDIFGGTGTTLNMSNVDDGNRGGKLTFISSSATGRQFYVGSNSSIYNLVFGIDSIEKARIDTNGNLGIGITSPTVRLHVSGSSIITNPNPSANSAVLLVQDEGTATTVKDGTTLRVVNNGSAANFSVFEASSGVSDFVILNNGNVGIGTTAPGALLEISSSTASSLLNVKGAGGNGILFVSGSGNVGIGTTVPVAKLQVAGAGIFASELLHNSSDQIGWVNAKFTDYNDGHGIYISSLQAGGGKWLSGEGRYWNSGLWRSTSTTSTAISLDSGALKFYTNSGLTANSDFSPSERMRINSDGNVGIGTTLPIAKLQVAGNISGSSFTSSVSNAVGFLGTSSWANNVVSASYATTAQTANALNTGNSYTIAGLTNNGTLSQQNTLSMGSGYQILATTGTVTNPGISFVGDTNTGFYTPSADNIGIVTNGSEKVRIDSSGNVGIGTTSPSFKLDVSGSGANARIGNAEIGQWPAATAYTYFGHEALDHSVGGNYAVVQSSAGETFINSAAGQVMHFSVGNSEKVQISSAGNVGINTQGSVINAKLTISGSGSDALLHIKSPISGAILYVSGSGAVGIGTSNVGAFTLQVSGSFGATTKSFIIDHPTKAGKKLMYGSLESPYHGIRLTGRDTLVNGKCKIQLPDYIYKLILHDSVNIQLTGIKCNKTLYVDDINIPENYFTIAYDKALFESYKDYDFFWDFTAIRADVPELQTEM